MKRFTILGIVLAIAVAVPSAAMAAQFRSGEDPVVVTDQNIDENLFVAGGNITVDSVVDGDAFIAGGQIDVAGNIQGDLFVGGGNVRIDGDVAGDVRIGGGNVQINGNIGGELMTGAGSVRIAEDSTIGGKVYIGAGQVIIAGTTGPIVMQGDSVRIESTAQVNGNLSYTSANEATIADGAVITGEVKRTAIPKPQVSGSKAIPIFAAFGGLLWLGMKILMLMLFVYLLPTKSKVLAERWQAQFWPNLLTGFLFLIATPVAAALLLVSVIGFPLGIGAFLLYPICLYLGKLVTAIAVGVWLRSKIDKHARDTVDWVAALLGLVVLGLVSVVPVLGALAVFIAFLAGLGALVKYDWELIQGLRSKGSL